MLAGLGLGRFASAAHYAVGADPRALAEGDLDGDGRDDLAVANYGSSTISILRSLPGGGFAPASVATGVNPRGIAMATSIGMVATTC